MIAYLTGRVAGKSLAYCLLDVHGVGFKLAMSTGSLAALPAEGDEVTVHTHLYVREDELALFGFESADEKTLFELLITVSGIGPKVALAMLSSLKPDTLREAIAREDVAVLSSVSGVGKKTAQRLIVELKDRVGMPELAAAASDPTQGSAAAEARDALLAMGFSPAEIAVALKDHHAKGGPASAEALVRHALNRLGGMR